MPPKLKKPALKQKKKATASIAPSPSLKLYRTIAVSFTVVTFALLAIVVYLSFSRATIRIVTEKQDVSVSFIADVVRVPQDDHEIPGRVVSSVFEQAATKEIQGTDGRQEEGKSGGLVTIVNTHSAAQPLVATTRLLTPEGVLFRIDDTINVPAGGTVEVMAHADEVGTTGDIGPSRFTIPGLSGALQTKIYAESSSAMVGGLVTVTTVSQENLDMASAQLEAEILEAAKQSLALEVQKDYSGQVFFTEVLERMSDTEPGEEAGSVSVSLKMRVIGVFFNEEDLKLVAEGKIYEQISAGMELVGDLELAFSVKKYDLTKQLANIQVEAVGNAGLTPASPLLDKDEIMGESPSAVKAALEKEAAISSVEVSLRPFWLTHIPTLKDHIRIIIE